MVEAHELRGMFEAFLEQAAALMSGDSDFDASKATEVLANAMFKCGVAGYGDELLAVLENSPHATAVEPLIVALKLDMGQDVMVADEVLAIASDIAESIRKERDDLCATLQATLAGKTDTHEGDGGA